MDLAPQTDLLYLVIQVTGTILFSLVFLFLARQSGFVYFGLWSGAWAVQVLGLAAGYYYAQGRTTAWLITYAFLQFAFAVLIVAAARAGFAGPVRNWRFAFKILLLFPVFLAVVSAVGWHRRLEAYHGIQTLLLCSVFFYHYASIRIRSGIGAKVFRLVLLMLSAAFLHHAFVFLYVNAAGAAPQWLRYVQYNRFYDFALNALLAFAAMAMWIEQQNQQVRELGSELDHVRRESIINLDVDGLTGLLNQSALAKRMAGMSRFEGVVSVCDMDNFKDINDRHGHLIGDEILRNVGHLLRASIRQEDEAFRWGGDEFVILFHNQNPEVVRQRMHELERRLSEFQLRGFGVLPISFSWGTAEANGRALRDTLDEADRCMYAFKRRRSNRAS